MGGEVEAALPWSTFKDVVRGGTPEPTWTTLLQHGGSFAGSAAQPLAAATLSFQPVPPPRFSGSADQDYALVLFPHHTLGDGRSAHLPWLQAAPDPLTSVTWQTWVELNPARARELGLVEGDLVRLESEQGSIEAPVYIHPGAPPDVLGVPVGQGHARYGRWAERRGANPLGLLAPLVDEGSGALAYGATRVRLVKTGRHVSLPKMEGTVPAYQIPGQEVIKISR
jgi:molybdopterin-containing oxidoreductase family iron-sulfur binding subunit